MEPIIIMIVLILLARFSWLWGVSSIDTLDSPEWERRRRWRGLATTTGRHHPSVASRSASRP